MIVEWLESITTSCPKHLRAMSYLRELIGIQSRYRRNKEAWTPHLENSKKAVLKSAELCQKKDRCLIIGTGLWHDVPVGELCRDFKEVVFADILHLPKVHSWAQEFPNLTLKSWDVTGLNLAIYAAVKAGRNPLTVEAQPNDDWEFDFVVSLNVWSQLSVLPWQYIAENTQIVEDDLDDFCQLITADHLRFLRKFPGVVCLMADNVREVHDGGKLVDKRDTLRGVIFPKIDDQWSWNLAPKPEQDPHNDIRLDVKVCYDLNS